VRMTRSVVIGAVTAMVALALPLLALPASAASSPPWEPDPNSNFGTTTTPDYGTLEFFNSAGAQVFGGNNLSHLFDYVEASFADPFAGTKAEIGFAEPVPNTLQANFPAGALSATSVFPNASAPAPLNTATNPVATLGPTDANLASFIASVTAQTAAGYANVFQIRLYTTGPGGVGSINNGGLYWDADVMVNPTAGTWQEVYPDAGPTAQTTTTVLAASPSGQAQQGSPVTLTATVTAADSTHPAGNVQFLQDGFDVDSAVPVNGSGVASISTTSMLASAPGGTDITATFTPTDGAHYSSSTSAALGYTVNPVAPAPAMSGAHQAGQKETCSIGMLDFGVKASFAWLVAGKSVGGGAVTNTSTSHSSAITVPGSAYKKALACRVSVSDGTGPVSSATTKSVSVSLGKALKPSKKPRLSGQHKVGKVESVKAGTWPRGVKFTYQWLLNGKVIKKATKSSLKLSKADKGKKISCRVTAHLGGFANGVATTASVKVTG
jgi:hypothetical protein